MSDLRKGDFFTVYEWLEGDEHSWVGDVLQVLGEQRPFLVVQECRPWKEYQMPPFTLNLHEVRTMPLTDDYVAARLND